MKIRSILLLSTVLLAFTAIAGCDGADGRDSTPDETEASQRAEREVRVETMLVSEEPFDELVNLTGTVEALHDAVISAEASGQVRSIAALGAFVQEGDIVAQLDDRLLKAQYDAARTAYELAEDTFRRQEALYQDTIISTIEYENVRAQRDQAVAQFEQAEKQLQDATIRAPFSGRIEQRMVERGELVSPGAAVLRIVNTNTVKITAGVPERYATDIRAGTPVTVGLSAYGQSEFSGRISFVGNVINPSSRTFPVEIEISNRDAVLKPEMVADVRIIRRQIENAITVPRAAVVRDETGPHMFVVADEDGRTTVRRRAVRPGPSFGQVTVIEDGLEPGEEVVMVGQNNVTDGGRIEVARRHGSLPDTLQTIPSDTVNTAADTR